MLLIKNAKVLTMAEKDYEKGCVLIDRGKIIEVAANIKEMPDCEVIDADNCWVMPGLIDAHSHIGITEEKKGFEGEDCNEDVEPVAPHLRALDAVNPMDPAFGVAIRSGITSVHTGQGSSNVVGGQFAFIKTFGSRAIDDLVVLEPSAMKIAFGENPKATYSDQGVMPSTRMAIAALLREELCKAKAYYEKKKEALEQNQSFEIKFDKECWIAVFDKKIPLKAHAHRADDIITAIRIAKEFDLNMTIDHCSEGHLIADEIARSGYPVIAGPNLASRNKIEVQYMDFKTAGALAAKGIKVAITTDHPVSRINCLPICAGLAVREGMDFKEALKAITINAAEICNVSHRVGSLVPEKDADIAIFDGNPMLTFTHTLYTIIDGKIVYDRKIHG